jgi:hypothetical protein
MSTQTLKIVEQNTAPPIQITCQRAGQSIDVTGCTVDLIITNGSVQTNTGHTSCNLVTPTAGLVQYTPQTGDFPTAGTYTCDVKITYSTGSQEVLYDQLKIKARLRVLSAT